MIIDFQQGIVSYPSSNNFQQFLNHDAGYVHLTAQTGQVNVAFVDGSNNYLLTESTTILNAWGPLVNGVDNWLYWDIHTGTGVRSFGITFAAPIVSATSPEQPVNDQHWFNTSTNTMMVYRAGHWLGVIRVFAGKIKNGIIYPATATSSYAGSQVGLTVPDVEVGRIMYDSNGHPLRTGTGAFLTTTAEFFVNGSPTNAVRLDSNIVSATASETIAHHQVVKYTEFGQVALATYGDVQSTTIALMMEDVLPGDAGNVVLQGVVSSPDWNWPVVGAPLWVHGTIPGLLVDTDPHVENAITQHTGKPPVARVLSTNSIVFDQGLGGKGDPGQSASANIPLATTTRFGAAKLTVNPVAPNNPVVVGTNDPRNFNDRYPLPHNQPASSITSQPVGVITGADMQKNMQIINDAFVKKTGDTMTGPLTLSGDPYIPAHAATKHYVDSRLLDSLSDVTIAAPTPGQSIVYNGTEWVNDDVVNRLADLSDVSLTSPSVGDSLVFDGSMWVNGNGSQLWKIGIRNSFPNHPTKLNVLQPTAQSPTTSELYIPLHTVINSDKYDNTIPFWTVTEGSGSALDLTSSDVAATTADGLVYNVGSYKYTDASVAYRGMYISERNASGLAGGYQIVSGSHTGRTQLTATHCSFTPQCVAQSGGSIWVAGKCTDPTNTSGIASQPLPLYFVTALDTNSGTSAPYHVHTQLYNVTRPEGVPISNDGPITLVVKSDTQNPITAHIQMYQYAIYVNVTMLSTSGSTVISNTKLRIPTPQSVNPPYMIVSSMEIDNTRGVLYIACGMELIALDSATLDVIWSRTIPRPSSVVAGVLAGVTVHPQTGVIYVVVLDNYVDAFSNSYEAGDQVMYAVAPDGSALWSKSLGPTCHYFDYNATSIVKLACDENTVYCLSRSTYVDHSYNHLDYTTATVQVAAIDSTTGVTKWERDISSGKTVLQQGDGGAPFPVPVSGLIYPGQAGIRVTNQAVVITYQQGLPKTYGLALPLTATVSMDKLGPMLGTNSDLFIIADKSVTEAPNVSISPFVSSTIDLGSHSFQQTAQLAVSQPTPARIFDTDIVSNLPMAASPSIPSLDVVNVAKVGQLMLAQSPPTSLVGSSGDVVGMVRFDADHLYYCAGVYDGTSNIWKTIPFSSNAQTGKFKPGPITNYPYGTDGDMIGDIRILSTPSTLGHGYTQSTELSVSGQSFTPNLMTVFVCTASYVPGSSNAIWQYITEPFVAGGLQSDVQTTTGPSNELTGLRRTIKVSQRVIDITASATASPSWRGSIIRSTLATPLTITLPALNTTDNVDAIASGWYTTFVNRGSSVITLTTGVAATLNSTTNQLQVGPGQEVELVVDNYGYFTRRSKPFSPWRNIASTGTIPIQCLYATKFKTTITGNVTLSNPTHMADGDQIYIRITQGGAGTYTASYGSKFRWGAAGTPVISTGVGQTSLIVATYVADSDILLCTMTKGYA